jgi:CBS domain-containing protein
MQKHNIGSVPVCSGRNLQGIVTDRDIIIRNVANGLNPKTSKAGQVMTTDVTCGNPNMSVEEASKIMAKHQIRRLPVVEADKLVGVVSLGDVAVNPEYDIEASEALTEISTPSRAFRLR